MELIENHRSIGKHVRHIRDGAVKTEGVIVAVRKANDLTDIYTREKKPGIQVCIKPDNGSRSYWAETMSDTP